MSKITTPYRGERRYRKFEGLADNPRTPINIIKAKKLAALVNDKMVKDNLTRAKLAEMIGVSKSVIDKFMAYHMLTLGSLPKIKEFLLGK